jgi:hypothetical protein
MVPGTSIWRFFGQNLAYAILAEILAHRRINHAGIAFHRCASRRPGFGALIDL